MAEHTAAWWVAAPRRESPRTLLWCFPYAGGNSTTIFREWHKALDSSVEILVLQLPGRGARLHEKRIENLDELVVQVVRELRAYLARRVQELTSESLPLRLAFYGHSFGSLLVYETLRTLHREDPKTHSQIASVLVGGRVAPHLSRPSHVIRDLTYDQFVEKLRRLGGTPTAVLNCESMMKLMVPVVRADWVMSEEYVPDQSDERYRIPSPLYYFGGEQDAIDQSRQRRWSELCVDPAACTVHFFSGGHFFVHSQQAEL
eukprot:CAMPEP_0174230346 /NCGR_PEP_ID=MMETSP0417-20130205/1112_1 /TAXON_ID=242541 /ORGANISM="Mayorella sp, Strain BSH-02190019" /LENGTH=258 /DNA_ID=CAMNT_0015308009 /DNA_START=125 /DNA_END=897 /DNA_ORIENTATION=-